MLGILRAGGLPDQVAAYAADLVPQLVTIDVYEGSLWRSAWSASRTTSRRSHAYLGALPRRASRTSPSCSARCSPGRGPDARFEFGLGLLVRGLASHARPGA